ncbi:uncharacterized protein LOC134651703 [Cydia amplana]|uniref:uncharacterized protein LOC134651703 n=1 Tax=Cydia amplana TaxID=1869771 RepID=UPI002FE60631
MNKLCARWVPRLLTDEQKLTRKDVSTECLKKYRHNPNEFLRRYITVDETWIHHYTPETKEQSRQWTNRGEPAPKKAKVVLSADLAPCDFHLFPDLKKWLGGQKFSSNSEVIEAVNRVLKHHVFDYFPVPYIKPCKWNDSVCLKASVQAAIPVIAAGILELGVASFDPMVVEKMSTNNAGLNLDLSQITITGLSQCKVRKVSRDLEKSILVLSMRCPLELDSHYNVSGNLVVIPIEGSGEFGFTAENVKMKLEAKIGEQTAADGKTHWKIASYQYSYEPDKVWIRITNLFGGDEKAGTQSLFIRKNINEYWGLGIKNVQKLPAPVLDFINQQWRVFIQSIGKPFVDECVKLIIDNVNKWMAAVPAEELEVD